MMGISPIGIDAKDNEPVIVVGFENNKDGYSNIKKQAKLFNQAFEALQEKYNFNNLRAWVIPTVA